MTEPRTRINACRMTNVVTLIALALSGFELVRYRGKYAHAMLRYYAVKFHQADASLEGEPGTPEHRRHLVRIGYYGTRVSKWRAAADLPIFPFTDDPPEPE